MNATRFLFDELEAAVAGSDLGRRAQILRRIADLFASALGNLSAEQISLFDDIMHELVKEVETGARVWFAERLTKDPASLPRTLRDLALDDEIDVAGPVLSHAQHLDEGTLAESARTKSQAHLLAISLRRFIPENVTDILVDRGDREVVLNTAANPGASFSEFGYSSLVRRSSDDDDLAARVWSRSEIPRPHLLRLFADASDSVKRRLSKEDPRKAATIAETVSRAMNVLQKQTRETSSEFTDAEPLIRRLNEAGKLDEAAVSDFANSKKFAETVLAFSLICDLPVGVVERAIIEGRSEQILVLAKAATFSWKTTKAILMLRSSAEASADDLDGLLGVFLRLKPPTARKAVEFYRLRELSLKERSK